MNAKARAESADWYRRARRDMRAAALGMRVGPEHRCFFAQQAAEKAIKTLVFAQIDFPYTHDLNRLRELVPPEFTAMSDLPKLSELSAWAIRSRYGGEGKDAARRDAAVAIDTARTVLAAVRHDLKERGLKI